MECKDNCGNRHECICPNTSCKNYGRCCDCVANHREMGSLPNCYPKEK